MHWITIEYFFWCWHCGGSSGTEGCLSRASIYRFIVLALPGTSYPSLVQVTLVQVTLVQVTPGSLTTPLVQVTLVQVTLVQVTLVQVTLVQVTHGTSHTWKSYPGSPIYPWKSCTSLEVLDILGSPIPPWESFTTMKRWYRASQLTPLFSTTVLNWLPLT